MVVRKRKKAANKKKNGKKDVKKLTVQQTIAYKEMGRDGICRVQGNVYSKCIRFYDINYQLAQNEDKNAIFENWCDFLNYFDSSIHFQLSFINHKSSMKEFEQVIKISPQGDAYDDIRICVRWRRNWREKRFWRIPQIQEKVSGTCTDTGR